MQSAPPTRPGFTLIELVVVISIVVFVSALVLVIAPALVKSEPASRGAQLLQSNLFIAKQQALHDNVPYGIRLLQDSDGQVRSFQFIQQPGDFSGGTLTTTASSKTVTFTNVDLSGGLDLTTPSLWPVLPGDYLQIQGGLLQYISSVPSSTSVMLKTPQTSAVVTSDYRIIRAARPTPGEDTIFLPDDIIVDMGAAGYPPTGCPGSIITPDTRPPTPDNPNGLVYYDILFSPSGTVLPPAANSGKIILWVRDTNEASTTGPDESLITIYPRTGLIASYPVDSASGNPYSFTQNPAAGGL